jgi:hypothetical protein
LYRLDECIQENMRTFEKERNWLYHPTIAVIRNSQDDLFGMAEAIFRAAYGSIEKLGFDNGSEGENAIHFSAGNQAQN